MVLSGVGSALREERLRRQFSLEHVSTVTRIAARYLEAIEDDRLGDLPGVVFARGFVRQYARFLDIPDEALLAQLPSVDIESVALPDPPPKPAKPFWSPRLTAGVLSMTGGVVVAGALATGWWYYDLTPVVRVAYAAAASTMNTRAARQAKTPVAVQSASTPAATAPAATSTIQVLLKARANAWVKVISDGQPAFTGVLYANDSREISGNQLVKIMTGNAGGLEVSLNGRPLDPLGPSGHVKTIRLTAEGPLPDLQTPSSEPDPL